ILLGGYRLVRMRHPRGGGMRVGFAGLTAWSFLMASAHGAGLMVVPFALGQPVLASGGHADHAALAAGLTLEWGVAATVVHAAAYVAVTAAVAWIVYEKLGVGLLRRAWINLD